MKWPPVSCIMRHTSCPWWQGPPIARPSASPIQFGSIAAHGTLAYCPNVTVVPLPLEPSGHSPSSFWAYFHSISCMGPSTTTTYVLKASWLSQDPYFEQRNLNPLSIVILLPNQHICVVMGQDVCILGHILLLAYTIILPYPSWIWASTAPIPYSYRLYIN